MPKDKGKGKNQKGKQGGKNKPKNKGNKGGKAAKPPKLKEDYLELFRKKKAIDINYIISKYSSVCEIEEIPSELVRLGLRIANKEIYGETKMIISVLQAMKDYLAGYDCKENGIVKRDLEKNIGKFVKIANEFDEGGEGFQTAINNVKFAISCLPHDVAPKKACRWLIKMINNFISQKIVDASVFIKQPVRDWLGSSIIKENDNLLVYGYSSVMANLLLSLEPSALQNIILVQDSGKSEDCKRLACELSDKGHDVIYTVLSGAPYFFNKVTKVFVGAVTVYANGTLLNVAGTAIIAAMAKTFRKPLYVFCQTFKFSEKSQIDSLICNTGYDSIDPRSEIDNQNLSFRYDLTPMKNISLIVSEIGMIPPSSVTVVLREFRKYDISAVTFKEN